MARPATAFRCFLFARNSLTGRAWLAGTPQAQYYGTDRGSRAPTPPKRPLTAFFLYRANVIRDVQAQHPDMRVTQMSKVIAQQYRELPENTKQEFLRESQANQAAYKSQMQQFRAALTPEQKDQLSAEKKMKAKNKQKRIINKLTRQLEKPRRPAAGAYMVFMQSKVLDRGEASQTEFVKGASRVWQRMPEQEKEVYNEQARANRVAYEEALTRWEQQMIKQGITSVVRVKNRPKPEKPRKTVVAKKVKKTASSGQKATFKKRKETKTVKSAKNKEE